MASDSVQVAERIQRAAADVYDYVARPDHIADWAPGLGDTVERAGEDWFVCGPMGRVKVMFAPANGFGVLDHEVTLPSGERFYNPLRVVGYGEGCEIVFSVRRWPGMSDAELERDVKAVSGDLRRLKQILESSE
ncbi:SRPBCC family protein [Actinoplanes subtropicus]|uniref:SRPBCC family protein n=1 Tax=Actinoplanes subtropicus TaxID=543632 RepID=UPI0004C2B407|nr:SRPBCC family protein [Actinoplanes subtropicus]